MARARTIKPKMFDNDKLMTCSFPAIILFQGLWMHADRRGIIENNPLKFKKIFFGFRDDVSLENVVSFISELKDEFITVYESDGHKCIKINKFLDNNSPYHNEPENGLPDICNKQDNGELYTSGKQVCDREQTCNDSVAESWETGNSKQQTANSKQQTGESVANLQQTDVQLDEIWQLWPPSRRTTRAEVRKKLKAALKKTEFQHLRSAVEEYCASPYVTSRMKTPDEDKIPHLPTWLHQERWTQDRSAWRLARGSPGKAQSVSSQRESENDGGW